MMLGEWFGSPGMVGRLSFLLGLPIFRGKMLVSGRVHPGRLTWNIQITHEKKGTWSSNPLWLCSMLIFQGVATLWCWGSDLGRWWDFHSTWKWMVGRLSFLLGLPIFGLHPSSENDRLEGLGGENCTWEIQIIGWKGALAPVIGFITQLIGVITLLIGVTTPLIHLW